MAAPASSRAYRKGFVLQVGLIPISLDLYNGVKKPDSLRKQFTPDGHQVGRAAVNKDSGELVTDVVHKAQADSGMWVELDDSELAALADDRSKTLTLRSFQPIDRLLDGTYVMSGTYYQARPSGKIGESAYAKAYLTLLQAMADEGIFALLQSGLAGNTTALLALTPWGHVRSLYFEDEVREEVGHTEATVDPHEVQLFSQLIKSYALDEPDLPDNPFRERVMAHVNAKAASESPVEIPEPDENDTPTALDLLASLRASVEAAKKVA